MCILNNINVLKLINYMFLFIYDKIREKDIKRWNYASGIF